METDLKKPDYAYCLLLDEWSQSDVELLFNLTDDRLIEAGRNSGKLECIRSTPSNYSGVPRKHFYDPLTVVAWAIAKGIPLLPVELIDWFTLQGKPKPEEITPYLDATHPLHSPELKIAVEAWQAVLQDNPVRPRVGSRKTLIESWLNTNHTELSGEAKKRIAGMVNPDKQH
jgi:hypothetical protein